VLVADAASELPRLARHNSPPQTVSLEGEVVDGRDGGETLRVRVGEETLTIEPPNKSRAVVAEGTPVAAADIETGTTIRVTAERDSKTDVVTARKIEVISPASAVVAPARTAEPTRTLAAEAPAVADTGADATPRPKETPKAAASTAVASDTNLSPALVQPTATPTPTPRPTATPSPTPVPTGSATLAPYTNTGDVTTGNGDGLESADKLR
jgi:hypothetical protein